MVLEIITAQEGWIVSEYALLNLAFKHVQVLCMYKIMYNVVVLAVPADKDVVLPV